MCSRICVTDNMKRRMLTALQVVLICGLTFLAADADPLQVQPVGVASRPASVASEGKAAESPVFPMSSGEYIIRPQDVLSVYVFDVPELSRDYVVGSKGSIIVPLLPGQVPAVGLSLTEFAHVLEEKFRTSGLLSRPQVTVELRQSLRSIVMVEGAVRSPQAVQVLGPTRLLFVLDQCGGLADDAGDTITITRGVTASSATSAQSELGGSVVSVDFQRLLDASDPMSRFEVSPGDHVSVEHAGIFYVLGEVNRPGGYNFKSAVQQLTVLQALAVAGDVTPIAKKDKAMIIRKDPKSPGGRSEIALNFKDIIAGKSPDQTLRSDDIIYVPASNGKKALRTFTYTPAAIAGAAATSSFYRY